MRHARWRLRCCATSASPLQHSLWPRFPSATRKNAPSYATHTLHTAHSHSPPATAAYPLLEAAGVKTMQAAFGAPVSALVAKPSNRCAAPGHRRSQRERQERELGGGAACATVTPAATAARASAFTLAAQAGLLDGFLEVGGCSKGVPAGVCDRKGSGTTPTADTAHSRHVGACSSPHFIPPHLNPSFFWAGGPRPTDACAGKVGTDESRDEAGPEAAPRLGRSKAACARAGTRRSRPTKIRGGQQ